MQYYSLQIRILCAASKRKCTIIYCILTAEECASLRKLRNTVWTNNECSKVEGYTKSNFEAINTGMLRNVNMAKVGTCIHVHVHVHEHVLAMSAMHPPWTFNLWYKLNDLTEINTINIDYIWISDPWLVPIVLSHSGISIPPYTDYT